ncbi:MAG: FtsX-like permease family protein, partial [Saprospiraceae bacterium]|nr:FtsX-like permease family protein [Saprospiraceae bacterium]
LTDETALQLFGTIDVIGNSLRLAGTDGFHVVAVVESWPDNAHLEFSMLLPYEAMLDVEPAEAREITQSVLENNWIATHSYTYVLLRPNQTAKKVNEKFKDFILEKGDERFRDKQTFSLLPITAIHLDEIDGEPKPSANRNYLYLFFTIGLLTLFIACINFINLTTANSMSRVKEVGVRKVLGAQRSLLIYQFLGESILLSFIAFLFALGLTHLGLPTFNLLTGLEIPFFPQPLLMVGAIGVFLLVGILAGLYPALYVTRFPAVSILKDSLSLGRKPGRSWLRSSLITMQFLAAIGFIAGSLVCFQQLNYLRNRPLGFSKDLIVNIPITSGNNINAVFRPGDASLRQRMNSFDESLLSNPNIMAVTQSYSAPGLGAIARNVWNEHVPQSDNFFPQILSVDYDYVETFDLEVLAGRDFDVSFGTDHISSFLLNEQAVQALGYDSPQKAIGKSMVLEGKEGQVVGVLKDYNFNDLRNEITPLIMEVRPGSFSWFSAKISNSDIPATIDFIQQKWRAYFPEKVFEYQFLDVALHDAYRAETNLATIIGYFSIISIIISCIGLFGLSAFVTRQRFKEIGIRKILGASVYQILKLLSREFLFLISISIIFALPITWYLLNDWLDGFAYRINFPWWVPLGTGIFVMLLAFSTVSIQALKTALSNPINAIKAE